MPMGKILIQIHPDTLIHMIVSYIYDSKTSLQLPYKGVCTDGLIFWRVKTSEGPA